GSAETETLEFLDGALADIHASALQTSMRVVIADVRGLEFASSSCLKAFVSWLQRVQALDDRQRYKVVFRTNPRYPWQRRSLHVLATFAAGVVEIHADSES